MLEVTFNLYRHTHTKKADKPSLNTNDKFIVNTQK